MRAEIAAGRRYLPAGSNVLRAFTFPFDNVRVLIVGQDPYPTPGHAVGLSFSVAPDVRPWPRSLANIFDEYTADLGYPLPSNGDLTPWAQRGVLLLNRVLTVRPSNPASHRGKGWEAVTECAIRALAARAAPLVAILWGRDASTLKPMLAAGNCVAIESPHRYRHRAGSSARVRSAAPTNCSSGWVPSRSIGGCPESCRCYRASAAGDLARLDAGCANVESLLVAAGTGHGVHSLDVRIPPAAGAAVGVRHRLAEAGAFPADIAHSGHSSSSSNLLGPATWPGRLRVARG